MKRYQITTCSERNNTAASKAVVDVECILRDKLGYKTITLEIDESDNSFCGKIMRQIKCFFQWIGIYFRLEKGSCLVMQHPFHHRQAMRESVIRALKKRKNVKYISIIHDVTELRAGDGISYYNKEFSFMTEVSDVFIVHNEPMKRFFIKKGIAEDKLIELGLFDYLCDENAKKKQYAAEVVIAGNLNPEKVAYIGHINQVGGIRFNLYGPGFDKDTCSAENIDYYGTVASEELPMRFERGFGLVWDGDSIDTCSGNYGKYLMYNNPHKLSLYLASGLPVVIWKDAAESTLVETEGVGITVESISDAADRINSVTTEGYELMAENAGIIQQRLRNGYYTSSAMHKAERTVQIEG